MRLNQCHASHSRFWARVRAYRNAHRSPEGVCYDCRLWPCCCSNPPSIAAPPAVAAQCVWCGYTICECLEGHSPA